MGLNTETSPMRFDAIKSFLAAVSILLVIAANYYFSQVALPFRILGMVVVFIGAAALLWSTAYGKQAIRFCVEAREEARKVIWPSRQETVRATMVVLLVVFVFSLVLWGLDMLLDKLIRLVIS